MRDFSYLCSSKQGKRQPPKTEPSNNSTTMTPKFFVIVQTTDAKTERVQPKNLSDTRETARFWLRQADTQRIYCKVKSKAYCWERGYGWQALNWQ